MSSEKPWYKSKTVWGGIVAVGAAVGGAFGLDVDAATQSEITQQVAGLAGTIGGLVAIYGRLTAKDKISKSQ